MKNKFIIGLSVVAFGFIVLIVAFLLNSSHQSSPVSATPISMTTTTAALSQPITPLQPTVPGCSISQIIASTSSWLTYKNSEWEISFAYPRAWIIQEGRIDQAYINEQVQAGASNANFTLGALTGLSLSGDGYSINIKQDMGHGINGNYKRCVTTIAGQQINIAENDTNMSSTFNQVFYVTSKNHTYDFYISGPITTGPRITDTFLESIDIIKD
jgi:hypothetical protein